MKKLLRALSIAVYNLLYKSKDTKLGDLLLFAFPLLNESVVANNPEVDPEVITVKYSTGLNPELDDYIIRAFTTAGYDLMYRAWINGRTLVFKIPPGEQNNGKVK